jgi:hypothetical protein
MYSLLLLGYKPVHHVTVLNTVRYCYTMVSIVILYYEGRSEINASYYTVLCCGPGSSVGIATGYGLDGPGIEAVGFFRLGKFTACLPSEGEVK